MLANASLRLRQSPSSAAEAARRKTIGAHADVSVPAGAGGGFRWGGQIMHSPDEAYDFARSHGSHLNERQFFNRYDELGQMQHPAAEQGLGAAAQPPQTVQPGGPMHGAGGLLPDLEGLQLPPGGHLPGIKPHRGGSSQAAAVKQALLAAHVIHRLRAIAALQHAAV